MTREQIENRLLKVEPWAPNYCGHVPSDWNEVVESANLPTVDEVLDAADQLELLDSEDVCAIDAAIGAAVCLPDGYEGVAVDVREI